MIDRLLSRLAKVFARRRIPYMLIGGQAVLFHGHPRLTRDVDVTLGISADAYLTVLAACREARLMPLVNDVAAFVRAKHVLPVRDVHSGLRVDLVFADTPYERSAIRRARRGRVGRASVPFASLEDMLVHKLVAGRPIDLEDARVLLAKHRATVNLRYVRRWLKQFAQVVDHDPLHLFEQLLKV
jgi:hypothetical protein